MKSAVMILGILCLLLSGCMSTSIDKNEPEAKPSLTSYKHYNLANINVLDEESYKAKKMKWILISTNKF